MSRKRSFISDVYKEKKRKLCSMGIANEPDESTSVRSALLLLKSLFPVEKFQRPLPPVIMQHQIYAFVTDRTEADRQLNEMKERGEIRMFKLGSRQEETAIVFFDDFIEYVRKCCEKNQTVVFFINCVVKNRSDMSFNKDSLILEYKMKEEHIRELIQQGLLVSKDVGCYWLSIPQVGEFVKTFIYGRRRTLQHVRRTKYNEILQSELESRRLPKKALLGMTYHIYDLIGIELIKCIDTGNGKMLRLQPQGS